MKRTLKLTACIIFGLCLCLTIVGAYSVDYYIIVEENGNSVVIMTIEGSGLVSIPIDEKTDNINVEGALYSVDDDSLDVSIGSTESAVVIYSTPMLTQKTDDWKFGMDLVESEMTTATIAISSNVTIIETTPTAFIDEHDFKEVIWDENVSEISMEYYFESGGFIPMPDVESNTGIYAITALAAAGILGGFIYLKKTRGRDSLKNKENIMRTLTDNEKKIVELMIESEGHMKRSKLEKKSGISKSSLAAALKNLEKKNIVELDKTYKTHRIKLTEWFDEL